LYALAGQQSSQSLVKLGAIGVRISRWVTMHGFAFNLTTNLDLYGMIVPCGIRGHGVTSIEALTGERPSVHDAAGRAFKILAEVFEANSGPLAEPKAMALDDPAAFCEAVST
jgi:lipoyl(octanoyl) transferase